MRALNERKVRLYTDLHGVDVLLGEQVVEGADVLADLDEAAAVITAEFEQSVRRALVALALDRLVVFALLVDPGREEGLFVVQADVSDL